MRINGCDSGTKKRLRLRAAAFLPAAALAVLLFPGTGLAGEKTENFWKDLLRKYPHESLVCLLDKTQLSMEYTGETVKRDATEMADFGADDRTSTLALGSTFLTSARWEKTFAVFDEVAAARFREWVIPLAAGETAVRTRIEVVDNMGKIVDLPPEVISVRPALEGAPELYSNVKELVFSVRDIPVPCIIRLYYTIEGEKEYGRLDRPFFATVPTYRSELVYNQSQTQASQFPWIASGTLRIQRIEGAKEETKQIATPQGQVQQFFWGFKNLKVAPDEPYAVPPVTTAPRVSIAPNFEADWTALLAWYAGGVEDVLNLGGNEVVLKPIIRDLPDGLETDTDKARAIYRYVQENYDIIPVDLGRDGYIPDRPVDIAGLEEATPRDLALLLVALFREAGLSADYGITSTADHGQINKNIVALHQFNRPVALLDLDDKTLVIDPTDRFAGLLDTPAPIDNNLALRVSAGEPDWVEIPPSSASDNDCDISGRIEITDQGKYVVSQSVEFGGEQNRIMRRRFYGEGAAAGDAAKNEWFGRNFPEGTVITGFDQERGESNDDRYRIVFDMEVPANLVSDSGDTITISGALFGRMTPAQMFPVPREGRVSAIEFPFAESGSQETSIRIPEGYEVRGSKLPPDVNQDFDFGYFSSSYSKQTEFEDIYDTLMVDDSLVIEETGDFNKYSVVTYSLTYSLRPGENGIPASSAASLAEFFDLFFANEDAKVTFFKREEEFVGAR